MFLCPVNGNLHHIKALAAVSSNKLISQTEYTLLALRVNSGSVAQHAEEQIIYSSCRLH